MIEPEATLQLLLFQATAVAPAVRARTAAGLAYKPW